MSGAQSIYIPSAVLKQVWDCGSDVEVNDLVYINSQGRLARALGTSLSTMPVVGIVSKRLLAGGVEKARITNYTILDLAGSVEGLNYFVSSTNPGKLTEVVPSLTGEVLQIVGKGLGSDKVLIDVTSTKFTIRG